MVIKENENEELEEQKKEAGEKSEQPQNKDSVNRETNNEPKKKFKLIVAVSTVVIVLVGALFGSLTWSQRTDKHDEVVKTLVNDSIDNGLEICISGTTTGRHYRSVQITKESEEFYYTLENKKAVEVSLENDNPDICTIVEKEEGKFTVKANAEGTGIITLNVKTDEGEHLARKLFISVYTRVNTYYGETNKEVFVYRGATENGRVGNDEAKDKLPEKTRLKIIATCDDFYLVKLLNGKVFSDDRPSGYVLKEDISIEKN